MIQILCHTTLSGVSASVTFVRDRELGTHDPGSPTLQLGYVHGEALRDDDVDSIGALVDAALEQADQRAQEAGGWSLLC